MRRALRWTSVACVCLCACTADGRERRLAGRGRPATDGPAVPSEGLPGEVPVELDPSEVAPLVLERPSAPARARGPDADRRGRRPVEEEGDGFFRDKLSSAREALDAGAEEAAVEIADAALSLRPGDEWGERFRALKAEARARRIEGEVLRADVRGVREYLGFAEDLDLVVRIRNVGTGDVVITPPTGRGKDALSGTTLMLRARRRDLDVYAAEVTRTWNKVVPLVEADAGPVRIPPEGHLEVRVRVPADDVGGAIAGMRVLEVEGDLRAGRIEAGLSEPLGRVRVRAGRVVVLPSNYEPLAADPLGSMRKAASTVSPVHLLVATEFLRPRERPSACALLAHVLAAGAPDLEWAARNAIAHLRRATVGEPMRPLGEPFLRTARSYPERAGVVLEGLSILTGVHLPADPRLWDDAWRKTLETGTVAPSDDGSATPGDDPVR